MEVVNEHEAMLSNYEVLTIIEETSALTKQLKKVKKGENVSTIQFEVKKYLSELNSGSQSTEKVHNLLSALTEFQLTKAEKLQILNVAPSELVQLVVLVEDFEERFNEEEQQRLLEVIVEKLQLETGEEEEEGNNEENLEEAESRLTFEGQSIELENGILSDF